MPRLDQTGPQGAGPLTGRGFGSCGRGMGRPKNFRRIEFQPNVSYFKPRGIPLSQLEEISLQSDELEALKLHDVDGLDHTTSADKMKVSQPTFGRILNNAYKKIASAIVSGKAIRIETNDDQK